MRFLGLGALCALLPVLVPGNGVAAGQSAPVTFTVHVVGGATRTALRLQPGFATVLRADHRVETVAIGDPRLVTATTVKRGQDVFDLVLQPQTATGTTNMIVWFGDLTSIWDLTIGPGRRTADIVYVVTAPPGGRATDSGSPSPGRSRRPGSQRHGGPRIHTEHSAAGPGATLPHRPGFSDAADR